MSNKFGSLLLCLLLLMPAAASAKVYEWVDDQGRHHYSDRQHETARVLAIDPGKSYYLVKKVFDGDTILLSNGQKVRFLGVNTPEVAGRNKDAEAGGEEAKVWLRRRLEHKKVRLEADVEKQDKYGRTLAHVFTEDRQHVNLELVQRGLAAVNIYPPNLKYVDSLLAAQQQAEHAGLGIWRYRDYAPQDYQALTDDYHGWKRITGRIHGLKKTAKYSYLQFSDRVAVRIENKLLPLFPSLSKYVGKEVEARAWAIKHKDRFVLPVRHPGELKVLRD